MIYLKGLALALAMNGTFMVVLPYLCYRLGSDWIQFQLGPLHVVGLLLGIAGALLTFWCIVTFLVVGKGTPAPFDAPKKLVISGLYRFVRNPMYVGNMSIVLGEAIGSGSLAVLLYAGLVFTMMNLSVLGKEEPDLRREYGSDYQRYCRSVPRWIPRVTPAVFA